MSRIEKPENSSSNKTREWLIAISGFLVAIAAVGTLTLKWPRPNIFFHPTATPTVMVTATGTPTVTPTVTVTITQVVFKSNHRCNY